MLHIPEEILRYNIFPALEIADLGRSMLVCREWNRASEDDTLWARMLGLLFASHPTRNDIDPMETMRRLGFTSCREYYKFKKTTRYALFCGCAIETFTSDVINHLRTNGLIHVDLISYVASLNRNIQRYGAVLLASNTSSEVPCVHRLGDTLYRYVQQCCGGVAVSLFMNCSNVINGHVGGKFSLNGLHPILLDHQASPHYTDGSGGHLDVSASAMDHAIMTNVRSFNGGRKSYYCVGELNPNARAIAYWNHGSPLVAELLTNLDDNNSSSSTTTTTITDTDTATVMAESTPSSPPESLNDNDNFRTGQESASSTTNTSIGTHATVTAPAPAATMMGRVVTLNFFPISSSGDTGCWDSSTDGGLIMANALEYVAARSYHLRLGHYWTGERRATTAAVTSNTTKSSSSSSSKKRRRTSAGFDSSTLNNSDNEDESNDNCSIGGGGCGGRGEDDYNSSTDHSNNYYNYPTKERGKQ